MGPCKAPAQARKPQAFQGRTHYSLQETPSTEALDDLERESPLRPAPRVDLPLPPPAKPPMACLTSSREGSVTRATEIRLRYNRTHMCTCFVVCLASSHINRYISVPAKITSLPRPRDALKAGYIG
jgi:hypothetical protein